MLTNIECRFRTFPSFGDEGGLSYNFFYYKATAPVDAQDAAVAIGEALWLPWAAATTNETQILGLDTRELGGDPESGDSGFYSHETVFAGGQSPPTMWCASAVVIQRRAHASNRRLWGRSFIAGCPIASVQYHGSGLVYDSDDTLDSSLKDLAGAIGSTLDVGPHQIEPCYRRAADGVLVPVSLVAVEPLVCSMHSRRVLRFGTRPYWTQAV